MDVSHLPMEETFPHDLRVGWSVDEAAMMLGEAPYSYSYCSIAKKAENGLFREWGQSYDTKDVISSLLVSKALLRKGRERERERERTSGQSFRTSRIK